MNFRENKNKLIIVLLILGTLALAFWYGGNAPGSKGWKTTEDTEDEEVREVTNEESNEDLGKEVVDEEAETIEDKPKEENEVDQDKSEEKDVMVIDKETGKDKYQTEQVPEGKPVPVEPEEIEVLDEEKKVKLSIRCDTILDNLDWLNEDKLELVPEDGVIFSEREVVFYEGESVFNVLLREMKAAKIHLEFSETPMYNSAYIEGINNIYEFDCGEKSGWMYKVNGWFPNYGVSRYQLEEGDVIEFVYTCNLGEDVGGTNAVGGD